jgi:hypothetical protein
MAKLIAAAINCPLSALAARTVVGQQRGFVKGRCLIDNILEVDDFLVRAAKYYRDKHGLALLDIRAAFPSLRQQWMFFVLSDMQIPPFILKAIQMLYKSCKADITQWRHLRRHTHHGWYKARLPGFWQPFCFGTSPFYSAPNASTSFSDAFGGCLC